MVVATDRATQLCCDAVTNEDAYTSERKLVPEVLVQARCNDLFVMDRYYCTTSVMQSIAHRGAYFVIREKEDNLRCRPLEKSRLRGRVASGKASE